MKRFHLIMILVLAVVSGILLSGILGQNPFGPRISWEPSLESSMKKAEKTHKILMLDFYADWCAYCKQMEKTSYRDPGVAALSHDFIMTKVNVDKHQVLARYFNIDGLPTLIFFKPPRGEVARLEGYVPPGDLAQVMKELVDNKSPSKK